MTQRFLLKLLLDPLPILDYFVNEDDFELIHLLLGEDGILLALKHHTVDPEYASHIARRMKIDFTPSYTPLDVKEISDLLSRPPSQEVSSYLEDRGFECSLFGKYHISSWLPVPHQYESLKDYVMFNPEELFRVSALLRMKKFSINLFKEPTMLVPSYDRQGNLNNLVFRFVNPYICSASAKWLFTHGRQATFGLELVDPSKPVWVVEGFFDYVAMREMGYQAVGLGSAFVSDKHMEFLQGLDLIFLLDSDETGVRHSMKLQTQGHKTKFLDPIMKDPYEYYRTGVELKFIERTNL